MHMAASQPQGLCQHCGCQKRYKFHDRESIQSHCIDVFGPFTSTVYVKIFAGILFPVIVKTLAPQNVRGFNFREHIVCLVLRAVADKTSAVFIFVNVEITCEMHKISTHTVHNIGSERMKYIVGIATNLPGIIRRSPREGGHRGAWIEGKAGVMIT